jgi:hypothetical protein
MQKILGAVVDVFGVLAIWRPGFVQVLLLLLLLLLLFLLGFLHALA